MRVEEIFWLEIAMRNAEVVEVGQALKEHFDGANRFLLVERVRDDALEKLFARRQFQHHVDLVHSLVNFDKLDDVLMPCAPNLFS